MTTAFEPTSSFVDRVRGLLAAAGLPEGEVVSSTPPSKASGGAWAIFRLGPVLLKVTCDRGREYLDLASLHDPTAFHQLDDVEIAMGWRSVVEVVDRREPEDLMAALTRVGTRLGALKDALSEERQRSTRAAFERAARERGEAFVAMLMQGR